MSARSDLTFALTFRAPDFSAPKNEGSANSDVRAPYQRDLGRIVHSSSFRRLQTKTQVMGAGEGDFHRTRLTHSLEVGQIGRGIVWRLRAYMSEADNKYLPPDELMEAICYGHDLGHPPFGHGGEVALHKMMAHDGGFEGNAQTLRILTKLEKYSPNNGLRPTRRLLLGILKYPVTYSEYGDKAYGRKPPKCFYDDDLPIVEKALEIFPSDDVRTFRSPGSDGKPAYRNFDCAIMELADDIAYGVHDLEDGIGRRLLLKDEVADKIRNIFLDSGIKEIIAGPVRLKIDNLITHLFSKDPAQRKLAISAMVGYFIEQIHASRRGVFESPYLDWTVAMPEGPRRAIEFLSKKITFENIIRRPEIQTLEYKGEKIIRDIFAALREDPLGLIGENNLEMQSKGLSGILKDAPKHGSDWQSLLGPDRKNIARGICDFVASMTDTTAERFHRRLFEPGYGSSTDELW